ncbi:hypothetical protein BV898_17196 [Hypsibius exemplaris]|uniref:Uncharacterized protein n=1 Tax=Hypsibius exemplaris TaxID=2072580 RepID=A0A9X6NGU2_HYPEX|nr:hypothetical protein BV898_17196 [Hypsibius exemplaris]
MLQLYVSDNANLMTIAPPILDTIPGFSVANGTEIVFTWNSNSCNSYVLKSLITWARGSSDTRRRTLSTSCNDSCGRKISVPSGSVEGTGDFWRSYNEPACDDNKPAPACNDAWTMLPQMVLIVSLIGLSL